VGRELLARCFPAKGATHRIVVATIDQRATARYLKAGVYARFPIYFFERPPEAVQLSTDLQIEPLAPTPEALETLGELDRAVLGHRRDVDHAWLLETRQGYLYRRDAQAVGYGYIGERSGPFALLHEQDFPAVLAHAEREAVAQGYTELGLDVPAINRAAVDHLLARGFQIDAFFTLLLSDAPLAGFERYVCTTPTFFL
jgi:hypothetical protein